MTATTLTVGIAAGGTGGHVFPALAVAESLRDLGHRVVWFGTRAGLEARVVPAAKFDMEWIAIGGLRGKGVLPLLAAPFKLLRALWQALRASRRNKIDVVLGMGGFVSGPVGVATALRRRPLLVHEQNATAGLTNRLLAKLAKHVLQAFPDTFAPSSKVMTVGNPVRAAFGAVPEPATRMQPGRQARVLVVGGSLGALALNTLVPQAVALLPEALRPALRHQGGRTIAQANAAYVNTDVAVELVEFIDDMPAAYAWADLLICRAGALTIAELAAAGCAAILVPFPYAVDDHQTANAQVLVQAGAAKLVQERDLTPQILADMLSELLVDRPQLLRMAQAAREQAQPQSCQAIVDACLRAAGAKTGVTA